MATSRLDRSDDTAAVLKIIAGVSGTEDTVTKIWQSCTISDSTAPEANKLAVSLGGAAEVAGDVAHDVAITGNPLTIGGVASAAAPTAVSTDQDAVRAWFLLNGAQTTVITAAGALIGGDATNGLDVDVTRLPALVAGTANIGDVDVLSLPALVAGTANIGDVDIVSVPAPLNTTGSGTEATALRVTLATDSTGLVSVDDNGGSLTVDGNFGALPLTAGGCLMYHVVSAVTDNAANIKASAGQVYGVTIYNNAAYPVYVKLHNTAGAPTAGAGVVRVFGCQAGTQVAYSQPAGMAFGTGIGVTIVKEIADNDNTAVALSDCSVDLDYK